MLAGIASETDCKALIDLAIDQSLPRDIRRSAGDRLNDVEGEALRFIRLSDNPDMLKALSRCGMVGSKFHAFAKGRLASIYTEQDTIAKLCALYEEQNWLLRQLPRKMEVNDATPF
jgi:hypothetical protein